MLEHINDLYHRRKQNCKKHKVPKHQHNYNLKSAKIGKSMSFLYTK